LWDAPRARTDSTTGPVLVTIAKSMLSQPNTFLATLSATKTLMNMASGEAFPNMGPCGFRGVSQRAGHPIASDTGCGSRHGVGPGWKMNRGALRPFTTAVGPKSAEAGAGCQ